MTARVRDSFHDQAKACLSLGSPLTARLLQLLADKMTAGTPVSDRVLQWHGDPSGRGDATALRLAGGLHALVLAGENPALATAYATSKTLSDTDFLAPVLAAFTQHQAHLLHWLTSAPQTNELRRSAALIAVGHWLSARYGLPLTLSELGASAGLNLIWDRYALDLGSASFGPADPILRLTPDWAGAAPPNASPIIKARRGVDLNPLNPATDQIRLLSYIWADQAERLARTKLALAEASALRPCVDRGDAIDWLLPRLAQPLPRQLHLIYHTVVWQYFPKALQARGEAAIQAAGARATQAAPVAHLAMESDGAAPGAALTLRLWPDHKQIMLGRIDFHGRWVDWQAPAP